MVMLRQDSKGNFSARKRLPDNMREEYGRLYGARFEAKFFAPASIGTYNAKQKFREWEAEVASRIAAIRAAQRGEGTDLTHKDAVGLAGEWYNWFVARYENDPGKTRAVGNRVVGDVIDRALGPCTRRGSRRSPIRDLEWTRGPSRIRAGIQTSSRGQRTHRTVSRLTEAYRSPTQHRPCSWIAS